MTSYAAGTRPAICPALIGLMRTRHSISQIAVTNTSVTKQSYALIAAQDASVPTLRADRYLQEDNVRGGVLLPARREGVS
jgi:hypothetical protein